MKKLFWSVIFVFIALGQSQGLAKSAKKQPQKPTVDEELRLKPGDEEGNELKSLKAELLISRSDERALSQLKKLMAKYKGTAMEASLHFRLAELYMRRSKTATFFEVHRDNTNVVKFTPVATKSTSSKGWLQKAVDTYDTIEKKFTHFRDMDLVLFNSAFARQILGQEKPAFQRYRRLVEDFSSSPLVPDCHLAIGESLFASRSFQAAFEEFQKIRKFNDTRVYPYGLYKGAWALYNLHEPAKGLSQLEEVVSYSKNSTENDARRLDLTREALDDMVLFFEDVKKPSEGVSYFRTQGGDTRASDLVLKLGKLYQRHGRFNHLEIVYNDLISVTPLAPERPQMHKDLLDGFEALKKRDKAVVQLESIAVLCDSDSTWFKAQKNNEDLDSCRNIQQESGKLYSSKWHREWKKSATPELSLHARRAYEALLTHSQNLDGEDKIRYNYAELLFQEKEFRRASLQYSKSANLTKDATLRHDAAYGALVSLEKAVADKWSDQDEREFARIAGDYLKLNPNGHFVTDVRFKKAFIAYEKGRFDEAGPQLKILATQFSNTDRGRKSAQLYLDVLNIQKNFAGLRDESFAFYKMASFDSNSRVQFKKIHEQASFTVIQNLENEKKYHEAMESYLAFIKEDTHSGLADKALYNAIRCANTAGDIENATKLSERLISDYPDSTYRIELSRTLVTLYEAQARLGDAADSLVRLSQLDSQSKWANLLAGADYKALNNEWSQASQIYNQLVSQAGNTHEGRVALERLEALAEKNRQWEKAQKMLSQIRDERVQPQSSLASIKIAQRAFDEGDDAKAFSLAKQTVAMKNENKVSIRAVAQARLIQGKILEKEFDRAGIKATPERLSFVLAIKTEKLENAQKAFQETISFGDRQTSIEALVRLAKCYAKYTEALSHIEAPANAPEEDRKKFLREIENLAVPIEEKSAETLAMAMKQAKDMQLHDDTIVTIQAALNRLSKKKMYGQTVVDLATPENTLPVVN